MLCTFVLVSNTFVPVKARLRFFFLPVSFSLVFFTNEGELAFAGKKKLKKNLLLVKARLPLCERACVRSMCFGPSAAAALTYADGC